MDRARKGKAKINVDLNEDICEDDDVTYISTQSDCEDDDDIGEAEGVNRCGNVYSQHINVGKQLNDFDVDDILKLTFTSESEGEIFYNTYARRIGFSIRKDDLYCDKNNFVVSRKWVCSRQGQRAKKHFDVLERIRQPRPLTRVGCQASFGIRFDKKRKKYVGSQFVKDHNHPLSPPERVHFLRSHRCVKSPEKAQAHALHHVGVKTSTTMDLFVSQSGNYEDVGFIPKDLRNHIDAERRAAIKDGDAEGALAYLSAKAEHDPLFFYKYDVDDEGCLSKLFWADCKCREDYAYFGDAIAFDTTYKTNAYKKPFVLFVGVNNHYQTSIFGCALLNNETFDTYKWVLETFIVGMNGKKPRSVVTDGDKAMRKAIKAILPESRHRLCSWHLKRNVVMSVHIEGFVHQFEQCMDKQCSPEVFESAWRKLVEDNNLLENGCIADLYRKRERWAEAYLQGQFFAGMRTTNRCEGMNSFFNRFLKTRLRLYEFLRAYDRALLRIRFNEAKAISETEDTHPMLTTGLKSLERHAARVFTRKLFYMVRDEIKREAQVFVVDKILYEDHCNYFLSKYTRPESTWKVTYYPNGGKISCDCLKFESLGIPCCHMISVMKVEHLKEFPASCILRRWTRFVRPEVDKNVSNEIPRTEAQVARYGALTSSCNEMSYYASQVTEGYKEATDIVGKLTMRMKQLCKSTLVGSNARQTGETRSSGEASNIFFGVRDPPVVKTKGAPATGRNIMQKGRRCGYCRMVGHTRPKCPKIMRDANEVTSDIDEYNYQNNNNSGNLPNSQPWNEHASTFQRGEKSQPFQFPAYGYTTFVGSNTFQQVPQGGVDEYTPERVNVQASLDCEYTPNDTYEIPGYGYTTFGASNTIGELSKIPLNSIRPAQRRLNFDDGDAVIDEKLDLRM